jgi:hypothetical protein
MFAKYHLVRRVHDHPAREEDLGIVPLELDLDDYARAIEGYGDRFAVRTLDEIEHRGRTYPIFAISTEPRARRLLVLAGVHGNEHAGLLAIPRILDRVRADEDVELCIVTPVNPVGAAHLSRYNGQGFDINRDFVRFDTREARAVRRVIEEQRPDLMIALHEGPQDATFFFANRCVDRALALRLLEALADGGTELAQKDYFGRTLEPAGYAPMSRAMWALSVAWAKTLGMMATGMYADDRGIPELTLESSWKLADPEARVRAHVDLVLAALRCL